MLSTHISAAAARRLLSRTAEGDASGLDLPDARIGGWTRRTFLQAIGLGLITGPAIGELASEVFGGGVPPTWASSNAPGDGILVVISLFGGNDGLNTVVPYGNGTYHAGRPGLSVPASEVLALDGRVGLHPRLVHLRSLYDAGRVAVVEGVGCPRPDFSHFVSMGTWMDGSFVGDRETGWIGRWLDGLAPAEGGLGGASIDVTVPLHMTGWVRRAVAISPAGDGFGADVGGSNIRLFDSLRGMAAAPSGRGRWHDLYASTMRTQLDLVRDLAPVYQGELPSTELATKLTIAARLINADLGLRVIDVARGGFDNHDSEVRSHRDLMGDLDDGLRSFFATLAPELHDRVALMTVSEFGRTLTSNGSGGTDHGTAAPLFVIGSGVRGGLYGAAPSLTALSAERQMIATVDFRSVYGSVIDGWLGGGGSEIVGGPFEDLRLFRSASSTPSTETPHSIDVVAPASGSGFVPVVPVRIFDTRDGAGGRSAPLGDGESWTFGVRGSFGVPSDAVAIVVNLTAVNATLPSFVTAWSSGSSRPFASTLNPLPGRAVPNLAIIRLGTDGAIQLFNNSGSVDLLADLVGYFAASSTIGFVPTVPTRVLDTRDGTGGYAERLGSGEQIRIDVSGFLGGSAIDGIALNVAATEPTESSHLTVWPAGAPRPLASNVNMLPAQTVSNLVVSGVGSDGTICIANNNGSTHVVADVVGTFVHGAGGAFTALLPFRVLDTRDGNGAAPGRIGQTTLAVPMLGRGGIPATGVGAVVLNVTAVASTRSTYVVAFPSDVERPLAASVNAEAGEVTPNMVIVSTGADGCIAMFNHSGEVDLVADAIGYFAAA